jgi:hypothetical protein
MAVVITQTANPASVASVGTLVTYSSVSIGTAASSRIIAVCVGTDKALGGLTPSSATIDYGSGDIAMTAGALAVINNTGARIFYLAVATGTTATIKVTLSGTASNIQNHIAVYSITGGAISNGGTDTSTDMDITDPLTSGAAIPDAGGFLAVSAGEATGSTRTWTGATEDIDESIGELRFSTAKTVTGGGTATCTGTADGEDGALAWISFLEVVDIGDWPAELPLCPILQGFSEQRQRNIVAFDPEVGPPKMRRRSTAVATLTSVVFRMTVDQVAIFNTFYETTLSDGTLPFDWPHPITNVIYSWMFDAKAAPQFDRRTSNTFRVSFNLLRLPA